MIEPHPLLYTTLTTLTPLLTLNNSLETSLTHYLHRHSFPRLISGLHTYIADYYLGIPPDYRREWRGYSLNRDCEWKSKWNTVSVSFC
ncbi:hypothetical protein J6590_087672 [Homalodisca vitripennis]|nr:hypothetical protein J6590_087672 [Homalodisca vitripennis]